MQRSPSERAPCSASRREQVAAHAGRGVREVIGAIGMTAEAARTLGLLLTVFGVATLAVGVLRDRVQPLQCLGLVAAATGGRARRAAGTVGAVAVVTFRRQFSVWCARDRCVTRSAGVRSRGATVGLMAAHTRLVTLGGRPVHVRVTALALLLQGAGVRLVAALALGVTFVDLAVLALVATLALHLQRFGAMRQSAVAVGAGSVPRERGRVPRIFCVALRAQRGPFRGQ